MVAIRRCMLASLIAIMSFAMLVGTATNMAEPANQEMGAIAMVTSGFVLVISLLAAYAACRD